MEARFQCEDVCSFTVVHLQLHPNVLYLYSECSIGGQTISHQDCHCDLGVIVSTSFDWKVQYDLLHGSAHKMLRLFYCLLDISESIESKKSLCGCVDVIKADLAAKKYINQINHLEKI